MSTPTREGPVAPLTTVFTPPADCSSATTATSCFPTLWHTSVVAASNLAYYSPGICPLGYTSACNTYVPTLQGPPALPGETAAICCRDNYSCDSGWVFFCVSKVGPMTSIWPMIQVRWQASDLPNLETNPTVPTQHIAAATGSSPSPLASVKATALPAPPAPAAGSAHSSEPSTVRGGLSTGAKAAIGVVVPLFVLAVLAALYLVFRKRQTQSNTPSSPPLRQLDDDSTHVAEKAASFQSSIPPLTASTNRPTSAVEVEPVEGAVRPRSATIQQLDD